MKKLIGILLLLCVATAAHAEKYVIGVESLKYYPHYDHDERQEYFGYARDLFDAFGEKYGHTFEYRILPVTQLWEEFLGDQLDLKYPDHPVWQKDRKSASGLRIEYSRSITQHVDGMLRKPQMLGEPLKVVGTIEGFTPWGLDKSIQVRYVPNFTTLLLDTMEGKTDAAYINVSVGRYHLRDILKQPGQLRYDASAFSSNGEYLLSTTKHPDVIQQINRFLMEEEELVDQLRQKYLVDVYSLD
jgi:ABC-type amino acid transport substrate-binding protein